MPPLGDHMTRPTTWFAAIAVTALTLLEPGAGGRLAAQEAKKPAAPAAPAPAAKPKRPAPVDDKVILPFLTEETFVVGRLDVDRVDFAAIERWVAKMSEVMVKEMEIEAEHVEEMKADTDESLKELRTWLDGFTAAGGRSMYVLVDRESLAGGG